MNVVSEISIFAFTDYVNLHLSVKGDALFEQWTKKAKEARIKFEKEMAEYEDIKGLFRKLKEYFYGVVGHIDGAKRFFREEDLERELDEEEREMIKIVYEHFDMSFS
jgi:hypothetical protein